MRGELLFGELALHAALFQSLEHGLGIPALGQEDHGGDDVGLEGSLFVERIAVAVKHGGLHLAVHAGDAVDVGGQAVQVEGLAVPGGLHQLLGAAPVLVLGVLGQQLLLQSLDAVAVALGVEVGALLHGGEGGPALGIDDVGVPEGLGHGVGLGEAAAGLGGVGPGDLLHLGHDLVALGMGQDHVHAEAGHQADDALGHGEGLAVGGGVGPGHGDLLALEVLHAAEGVDDVEHIGHALGGVVDVALEVDQSGLLLQDAVLVALGDGVDHFVHVGVALADVHVVPDADDVCHEGDHVGGLTDGLAVGDLALALVQVLDLQAQQVAGGGEGETGAGGVVAEEGDAQAGLEDLGGDVVLAHVAQGVGDGKDGLQLVVGLFPGEEEVALVHLLEVELVELVDVHLQSLIHGQHSLKIINDGWIGSASYREFGPLPPEEEETVEVLFACFFRKEKADYLMSLSVFPARNWETSDVLFSAL